MNLNQRRNKAMESAAPFSQGMVSPRFEGSEHTHLGDGAILYFSAGDQGVQASKVKLTIPHPTQPDKKQELTYGQIVALAGDFYGDPAQPISKASDPVAAFQKAFDSLAQASATPSRYWPQEHHETQGILRIMQEEINAVDKAIQKGESVEKAFEAFGNKLHGRWNYETGGTDDFSVQGRYLKLSAVNWDHFGRHAVTCYKAGHELALAKALEAKQSQHPEKLLTLAYAINAFADHYLSDLFSAGHLRTPRWELPHDESHHSIKKDVLNLCSKFMHDEDSRQGLYVTNSLGDSWKSYGDKRYFSKVGTVGKAMASRALRLSVAEVAAAFLFGTVVEPKDFAALRLVPDLVLAADYEALLSSKLNHAPLFIHKKGTPHKTLRRTDLADLDDYKWVEYDPVVTVAALELLKPDPAPVPPSAPVPTAAPSIAKHGWQTQQPRPPRWVEGNQVRYAVKFFNELSDSPLGPWSDWVTLGDHFLPTLEKIPTLDRRAPGRIIYRQFWFKKEKDPRTPEAVGRLGYHEIKTTVFVDRKS